MPDVLTDLEHGWGVFAQSAHGRRVLARWQQAEPILAGYGTFDELTVAAQDQAGRDLDHRDELHLALLRLSARDEDARLAMLHLLRPALVSSARLYSDVWHFDEAASITAFAALDRIVRYPHGLPRPAASIVRWVRRALGKEAARLRRQPPLVPWDDCLDQLAVEAGQPSCDELVQIVARALDAGVIDEDKARLVLLNRVVGVSTADMAELAGSPKATIRQRRNRAEAAIAAYVAREAA
jgi:DNA-directed RNA polymerase specialized sigma24 family protein